MLRGNVEALPVIMVENKALVELDFCRSRVFVVECFPLIPLYVDDEDVVEKRVVGPVNVDKSH